jgi:hypothetical protein
MYIPAGWILFFIIWYMIDWSREDNDSNKEVSAEKLTLQELQKIERERSMYEIDDRWARRTVESICEQERDSYGYQSSYKYLEDCCCKYNLDFGKYQQMIYIGNKVRPTRELPFLYPAQLEISTEKVDKTQLIQITEKNTYRKRDAKGRFV